MPTASPISALRPRLLLVEDDPAVRRSLQLLLSGRGYEVRAYASSLDLLADETAVSARGLIADFRMPDADGLTVLRNLRDRGWSGSAVLITGFPGEALTEQAIAAGFNCVLPKPLVNSALIDAVERLVGAPAG